MDTFGMSDNDILVLSTCAAVSRRGYVVRLEQPATTKPHRRRECWARQTVAASLLYARLDYAILQIFLLGKDSLITVFT